MNINIYLLLILCMQFQQQVLADTRQERLFEDGLCLQVKFAQGQPLDDLQMVKDIGVKWVREEIAWSAIEPRSGVYNPFPEALKKRLAFYRENNIGVIFIMAYENSAAYPNSKDSPNNFVNEIAFGKYVAYMVTQLRTSGVRFAIELWNEPHNSTFAKKEHFGGNWQGAPPSPWVDHYTKMVAEAVKRVKAIDPTIKMMVNDDMWIVHYHFLEKGLPQALDGLSVHPYTGGNPPELTAVKYNTDWTRPFQVVDQDQSFESAVRRLKEQGIKKMGKSPAIWVTEWGWRVGENSSTGILTESKVAEYLPRAFILAANAGVEGMCWFSAMDGPDGPMGLKTNSGRKRPAYDAFLKLSNTLGKTQFICELKQPDNKKNLRSFAFRKKKSANVASQQEMIIATWDTTGASNSGEVIYQPLVGDESTISCK
jgi:hypothetical protein